MVDKETVRKVAENARINLSEDEVGKFRDDLNDILEAFESLDDIDAEDADPAFHPIELGGKGRDDDVEESFSNDEALSNSENTEKGMFKGPRAT